MSRLSTEVLRTAVLPSWEGHWVVDMACRLQVSLRRRQLFLLWVTTLLGF